MIRIELLEFLRTGEWGPVRLGTSLEAVLSIAGEPDFRSKQRRAHQLVALHYGRFEFYFDPLLGNVLTTIYADHFDLPSGGPAFLVDPGTLCGHLDRALAEAALEQAGIRYAPVSPPDPTLEGIRTDAGVELWFGRASSSSEWPGLYAVCCTNK